MSLLKRNKKLFANGVHPFVRIRAKIKVLISLFIYIDDLYCRYFPQSAGFVNWLFEFFLNAFPANETG
jgi:hypothetical protein